MSIAFSRGGVVCLAVTAAALHAGALFAADLSIVREGRSAFRIYHAADAPPSVVQAAGELRHYVGKATGADLAIDAGARPPDGPIISLGDNAAARAAGLDVAVVPLEGFRIAVRGDDLFVLGPDTARDQTTATGGTSCGTRNGVYALIENELGVRWLMPGEVGEDVPQRSDWSIAATDRSEAPGFRNRRLPYIQNGRADVTAWQDRMRLGYSLRLNHGHNWQHTVSPDLFREHPDWFAMVGGRRVPPVGRYKLETTHPELVAYYAERAIAALKDKPELYTYSLSPSDSAGWSESPESLAFYRDERDPTGKQSITPLILDFYIKVADRVAAAAPDRAVAGYIYANYLYPPSAGVPKLPANLYLVIAPSIDYGYTLYRDDVRAQFDAITQAWTAASGAVSFYDLPTWLRQNQGAPAAPGIDILRFIFPRLKQRGFQGVYIYGQAAWGHGALSNYLLAKLMWDPAADPAALADEFCRVAYGEQAGPSMRRLYDLLDEATREHYRADSEASYTLTPAILQDVYVARMAEIEQLFRQADAAAREPAHRARLAMFEKNLLLLHWNLRHRGLLGADAAPTLRRDDAAIEGMLADRANELALSPEVLTRERVASVESVRVSVDQPVSANPAGLHLLRGPSRLLICPQADDEVTITPARVTSRGELVRYTLVDSLGRPVSSGVVTEGQPIRFAGSERQAYFLEVDARSASYRLDIHGAPWAVRVLDDGEQRSLHFLQHASPVYFHVPAGMTTFELTLHSAAPGETAALQLLDPSGRTVATMDTSDAPVLRQSIEASGSGWWTVRFIDPRSGSVDDVYLSLDSRLSPWVALDGRSPLRVEAIAASPTRAK